MDRQAYDRMELLEKEHWWFCARRQLIRTLLERHVTPSTTARVLEAGCGFGGNANLLREFGELDAFELDDTVREAASKKTRSKVEYGALPDEIPFGTSHYDLICLFDVLEHVRDDARSLERLRDRLTPTGKIVLTVPAFPALWSAHDESHHHRRRYTRGSISHLADAASLQVVQHGYFNTFLLPVAVTLRCIKGLTGRGGPDDSMPPLRLNAALESVFAFERHVIGRVGMPAGLSLFAVLRGREQEA